MSTLAEDIFTKPSNVAVDTLKESRPLERLGRNLDGNTWARIAMAVGKASATATSFELVATRGSETYGICSNPFLEYAFRTLEYRIKVTINLDGTWSYDEDTELMIRGNSEPFHHTDRSTLIKIGEPTPKPLARKQ